VSNLKKAVLLLLALAIGLLFSCAGRKEKIIPQETAAVDPNAWKRSEKAMGFDYDADKLHYELVWSDEFDYEGPPDPAKWTCETGGHGWGNNELEYYTNGKNVRVDGQKMIIEARQEQFENRDVTSTRIITKNKGDWLYGKIEVSAKIPRGLGTWPAIWMLPTDWEYGNWPNSGEIDIMEHVGYDYNTIHTTVHTGAYNHSIGTQKGKSAVYKNVDTEFHLYSIEWLPDKIRFFVDQQEQYVFDPSKLITAATYKQWPFDKRFHLLINLAFGGNWGGAKGVDYGSLPATMEVDYVRVYQSPEITALAAAKTLSISGNVDVYLTTKQESMFVKKESLLPAVKGEGIYVDIEVDVSRRFQKIDGFGASFTDSSAYLINQKLDSETKEELMVRLFDPKEGIGLSFTRQPMGASDYARSIYSFDDMPRGETDPDLAHFSIDHDRADIIPLLKRAKELNPELLITASPWSPPGWMKTSDSMIGGSLRPEFYDVYAEYFVRYIKAYRDEGLDIYAVTPQNEPQYVPKHYPGCGMDAKAQAAFIQRSLGPAFRSNALGTKILGWDHNWDVTDYAETLLKSGAAEYLDGIAWHWYGGDAAAQSKVREQFPNTEVYFTEGSGGEWIPPFADAFMAFMVNGIKILNNYSRSLVFWNMALDEVNGPVVPGFGRSTCRGIVKINQGTGELTYNLDYYALAHFSQFIRPGAERVFAETKGKVYVTAFLNRDNTLAIVAANDDKGGKPLRFTACGQSFALDLPGKSAATLVMKLEG
jgi:glucosylceramidase